MPVEEEIAVIYCGTQGLLRNVELKHVAEFEKMFLEILRSKYQKEILVQALQQSSEADLIRV